jgi:DNA-binding NarL/FixJ family response regulator
MIKVGIIEDNTALRGSLTKLINSHENMACVLSVNSLMHIISDLVNAMPNILLMDIGLPNISGIEGVKMIKMNFPEIQILMFTVFEDEDKIFDAIRFGASGYLLKKTPPEEIVAAILQLNEGGAPMTASIARKVIQSFQEQPVVATENYSLTAREKEILYALVEGLSYKKIADKYFLSISTIRTHICNIYQKLHVNSKSQAVAKILQNPSL